MHVCALPVLVARNLGATMLIVTASVGGLDPALSSGALVVSSDHINLMGENPLSGWTRPDGAPAFVDLTEVYDLGLADLTEAAAAETGVPTARGVYVAVRGPSYETRAEMEFMRRAGGTVVGMSVVPESVPAAALGMRCLGLFIVTNTVGDKVSHDEVVRVAAGAAVTLGGVLQRVLPRISA
jgi:purine-nucleoside phosphorylase